MPRREPLHRDRLRRELAAAQALERLYRDNADEYRAGLIATASARSTSHDQVRQAAELYLAELDAVDLMSEHAIQVRDKLDRLDFDAETVESSLRDELADELEDAE